MEKLYNVVCQYSDIFLGNISFYALEKVSKGKAEKFIESKKYETGTYEIIEVKK
ncbi:Uncharacterised protein [Acinetobacter phage MD-2021a]|nr:Uncharacterised protein [Acinetobacter phage MD-2021a]CAH1089051.1 Uncharacterised protein [Acinetobacter phage MD-2021a]